MRTTRGKPTLALGTEGEPALAAALGAALAHTDRQDRCTHGFHTYPAGLHPEAARDLLAALPGRRVLDPFCGGGTVLVEALRAGREVEGADVSAVARLVARLRTARTDEALRTRLRATARALTEQARQARDLPSPDVLAVVGDWYAPEVLRELASLRRGIEEATVDEEVRILLLGVLSSLLIKVSWQVSDTSARREPHVRPPGTTAILFHKKARELARRLEALEEDIPEGTPPARVVNRDARTPLPDGSVDLVLTSPPYPAVYDYLPMQALREAWLGVRSDAGAEIGARRDFRRPESAYARWVRSTDDWIAAVARALAPGGHLAIVVGDGLIEEGTVETREPTLRAAHAAGLVFRASATLSRPDHARRAVRDEHVMVVQAPGRASGPVRG
ncbi:MAG: hypothetical protein H6732_05305 [Alphaproteobacteria bacterium]|nr:hypothetical protein [Alphaproteobacteria bacterium]